jgi:hypothetical protein
MWRNRDLVFCFRTLCWAWSAALTGDVVPFFDSKGNKEKTRSMAMDLSGLPSTFHGFV